jgi:hypothetical protein
LLWAINILIEWRNMAKITVEIESRCLYPSDEQTVTELFDLVGLCEYGDDVETGNDFDVALRSDANRLKNSLALDSGGTTTQADQREVEILGSITAPNSFARTTGTWTLSALVGYRAWIYNTATPDNGVWHEITANDATTFNTVLSTLAGYNAVRLQARAAFRHLVQLTPKVDFYGSFFQYKVTKKLSATGLFKWFGVKGNSIPINIDPEFFAGMGANSNGWEA